MDILRHEDQHGGEELVAGVAVHDDMDKLEAVPHTAPGCRPDRSVDNIGPELVASHCKLIIIFFLIRLPQFTPADKEKLRTRLPQQAYLPGLSTQRLHRAPPAVWAEGEL